MIKTDRKESICSIIGRMMVVALFVTVLSFMPKANVYAATTATIGDYIYSLDDSTLTATVTSYVGAGGDISVPATVTDGVNTYNVTSIGSEAFRECNNLTSVIIPNGVVNIGNSAFWKCSNLARVTIPNSVVSLGVSVFAFTGLTSITIPDSITVIPSGTCAYCSNLVNAVIPNSVTKIEGFAFEYCSSLGSVMIPSSVTWIAQYTYEGCTGLETVYYPSGLGIANSQIDEYGATLISYSSNVDGTVTLLIESIKSGIASLEIPSTVDGKTVSTVQCKNGLNKLTITPNTPVQTMNATCGSKKVSELTLSTNWVWDDADKNTALTVGTPVTATAVYNGLDKEIYKNTEVEITITTTHTGETILKNKKTASCKETGYTGDTHCATCDEKISEGSTVPKSNTHTGDTIVKNAKTATCKEEGYTGDTWCNICNTKISNGNTLPKTNVHSYDNGTVTKQPTVTETGVKTFTCTVCNVTKTEDIDKLPATSVEKPKEENPEETPETDEESSVPVEPDEEEIIEEDVTEDTEDTSNDEEETTAPVVQPEPTVEDVSEDNDEEADFNILFVIIPVVVLAGAGGIGFVFFKKKK